MMTRFGRVSTLQTVGDADVELMPFLITNYKKIKGRLHYRAYLIIIKYSELVKRMLCNQLKNLCLNLVYCTFALTNNLSYEISY